MEEKIITILNELRPELDLEKEDKLIDKGVLDSFDLVSLIGELNDQFEIDITFDDIEPENFNSVAAMARLVARLKEA